MIINTTHGPMDTNQLTSREFDNLEGQHIVEYYLGKELVHRSVELRLKGIQATAVAQPIG